MDVKPSERSLTSNIYYLFLWLKCNYQRKNLKTITRRETNYSNYQTLFTYVKPSSLTRSPLRRQAPHQRSKLFRRTSVPSRGSPWLWQGCSLETLHPPSNGSVRVGPCPTGTSGTTLRTPPTSPPSWSLRWRRATPERTPSNCPTSSAPTLQLSTFTFGPCKKKKIIIIYIPRFPHPEPFYLVN